MSLAIVAFDSKQAFAMSDGRYFTIIDGKKEFFRDDQSKIMQITPFLACAATNRGPHELWRDLVLYMGPRLNAEDAFEASLQFVCDWLDKRPDAKQNMRVALFGWDFTQCRMRCCVSDDGFLDMVPTPGKPTYVAIGKTEGVKEFLADRIKDPDPIATLDAAIKMVEERDTEVGGNHYGGVVQAPEPYLSAVDEGQVWPVLPTELNIANLGIDDPASQSFIAGVKEVLERYPQLASPMTALDPLTSQLMGLIARGKSNLPPEFVARRVPPADTEEKPDPQT